MKTHYQNKFRILPCLAMMIAQVAFISAYAAGADEDPGQFSPGDYKFAKAAACGGMFEVNLGNIAAVNSRNTAVQQFGMRMARDHGKAGQQLQQIASNKGAALPSELPVHMQKEVDRMAKLSGAEFDKAYMACMVRAHKADEKAFKKASEDVQDSDLRAFAATTLTMVQDHLKMAEDLDVSIKHELSSNP